MVCLLIPILYDPGETAFTDLRRSLTHAVSCTVRQDTSGRDELALKYPVAGAHADEIGYNSIILAKPNLWQRPQPYRVYSVSKPANGLFSVAARHLAYDGLGIPVKPFTATSAADAAIAAMTKLANVRMNFKKNPPEFFDVCKTDCIRGVALGDSRIEMRLHEHAVNARCDRRARQRRREAPVAAAASA